MKTSTYKHTHDLQDCIYICSVHFNSNNRSYKRMSKKWVHLYSRITSLEGITLVRFVNFSYVAMHNLLSKLNLM